MRIAGHDKPPITPTVHFFALARQRLGQSEIVVELPADATVAELRQELRNRWPNLAPLWSKAMIALDDEYAADDAPIQSTSRVAVIPPVSGGFGVDS